MSNCREPVVITRYEKFLTIPILNMARLLISKEGLVVGISFLLMILRKYFEFQKYMDATELSNHIRRIRDIDTAFTWSNSPEGGTFWNNMQEKYGERCRGIYKEYTGRADEDECVATLVVDPAPIMEYEEYEDDDYEYEGDSGDDYDYEDGRDDYVDEEPAEAVPFWEQPSMPDTLPSIEELLRRYDITTEDEYGDSNRANS